MKYRKVNLKNDLLEALEKNLGLITPACKETGVSRDTYYKWLEKDEVFRKRVQEINEIALDFVESQLFKKIKDGSERSILFFMKYKARSRGYIEKIDIEGNINNKVDNISVEIIKNKKDI